MKEGAWLLTDIHACLLNLMLYCCESWFHTQMLNPTLICVFFLKMSMIAFPAWHSHFSPKKKKKMDHRELGVGQKQQGYPEPSAMLLLSCSVHAWEPTAFTPGPGTRKILLGFSNKMADIFISPVSCQTSVSFLSFLIKLCLPEFFRFISPMQDVPLSMTSRRLQD